MKFTYYGHACFSISLSGRTLLFDPFISGNELAKHIDIDSIEADYILVSHGHGDHVGDLLSIARRTGALVIANAEITDWTVAQGYDNVHPMNFGSRTFDFGKLHFVPAAHSSSLPDGTYGGNPGGFVIQAAEKSFYYAGDTSLSMEMHMIPHYASLDLAILPIGGNFTMDPEDALYASTIIKCDHIIGVHFDTFGYIVIDHQKAKDLFSEAGKRLVLPTIGGSIDL